ncbi:MAG TPA: tetratricopeptide repeat protein [Thermoanaerobaculia bacterium]|nr:tetratricopeptide repeat protein [Thermoanaerobaculia bacterium]
MKRAGAVAAVLLFLSAFVFAQQAEKLEAEAKRAFDSGRFKEAAEKYAKAADSPDAAADRKGDLYLNSAWAFYIAGNSKSARDSLRAAYSARPDLVVVGDLYSPDFARLAQSVRAEIGGSTPLLGPAELRELKRSARKKLIDGKAEEALAELKPAAGSNDPEVQLLLAEVYEKVGRAAEADTARQRASDLQKGLVTSTPISGTAPGAGPTSPIEPGVNVLPLLDAADKAIKAGDLAGATTHARRAADLDPKSGEAHRLLGEIAFASGQDADAEREFTAAVVLDASNPRAELGLARTADRQKKWNTAASHYRRALELDPRNLPAALGLGRAMDAAGDESAARTAYGRAIEIDAGSAEAHNDFGVLLYRAGDADAAIQHFSEAAKLRADQAEYHENLGRAYRKKGMAKEAERELAEAARLAAPSASLWSALGHLRSEQKNAEEARRAFTSALEAEPGSEEAASGLAAALFEAGKLEEAEGVLVKSLEVNPASAVLWNDLGVVRMRRGDFGGSVEALHKALSLEKPPDAAKANLERAEQLLTLDRAAS